MNKPVLTNVDAHMRKVATSRIEEDQVTWQPILPGDLIACVAHLLDGSGQRGPQGSTHDIDHQATAVKATFGRVAAPSIGRAHQRKGVQGWLGQTGLTVGL
jgi:hypothetical protein